MDRLNAILELLDSIKAQTYPNTETIVIVERSMELLDRLKQYINEETIPNTKGVFNNGEHGLSAARNLGVKETRGDIIAFIDDDALPAPDWAEEMVKTYRDDSVIGVTGPSLPLWEDEAISWVPEEFYWIIGGSGFSEWTEKREVRNVSGTNMSFRREAFDTGGLFLTQLGARGGGESGKHEFVGDETEFSIRVSRKTGKRIMYNPKVKVQHRVYKFRVTPMFIGRRAYWEGYTKAMFKRSDHDNNTKEKILQVEYQLLRRIMTRLFPKILGGFFTNPVTAWHRLSLTINATVFVAVGYFYYSFRHPLGRAQTLFHESQ
jgi:cellulose synthase/poly-beta-1,6-N-acetylglucosamine synthase-like glycosyltransferase